MTHPSNSSQRMNKITSLTKFLPNNQPCPRFLTYRMTNLIFISRKIVLSKVAKLDQNIMKFKKLPSRGKQLVESPWIWMKEKKQQDHQRTEVPPNLWCIEGSFYDFSEYIQKHPGGQTFLQITQGHDVTELFNTHHLNQPLVREIVKKYYISTSNKPYDPLLTFENDGFYRTLQKKVLKYFQKKNEAYTYSIQTKLIAYGVLVSFFFLFWNLCKFPTYQNAFYCGLILHICLGLGHNFMHKGSNEPLRLLHDLTFASSHHWVVSHCISHHHYPNSIIDFEISGVEPYSFIIASSPKNPKIVFIYMHLFQFFITFLENLSKILFIMTGNEEIRIEFFFPLIEFLCLWWSSSDAFQSLKLLLFMQGVASYLMTFVSFIVHRTCLAYSDGTNKAKPEEDFGLYCLQTTHDYYLNVPFPLNLLLFESFNDHILHHLFPTIDISKLGQLHGLLEETLAQFGRKTQKHSFWDLYKSHLGVLNNNNRVK